MRGIIDKKVIWAVRAAYRATYIDFYQGVALNGLFFLFQLSFKDSSKNDHKGNQLQTSDIHGGHQNYLAAEVKGMIGQSYRKARSAISRGYFKDNFGQANVTRYP